MTGTFPSLVFAGLAIAFPQDSVVVEANLEIGVVSGPEEYILGSVWGLDADEEGTVFVSDRQLQRIQVYDSLGVFRRTIGREGLGPGELQGPMELALLGDGTMVVADVGFDAYLWWDGEGEPIGRTVRPRTEPFVRDHIQGDGRGRLLDARRSYDRTYTSFLVLRMELTGRSELRVDSVTVPAVPETVIRPGDTGDERPPFGWIRVPFAPLTTWTPIEGGVAYSRDGEYLIGTVHFDGTADTLVSRLTAAGPPIPERTVELALQPIRSFLEGRSELVGRESQAWAEAIEPPTHFPPILRLLTGPTGNIWVLRAGPDGSPSFDVWSEDGLRLGTVQLSTEEWPEITVMTVSGTHLLARFALDSGVQVIRGFPIPATLR